MLTNLDGLVNLKLKSAEEILSDIEALPFEDMIGLESTYTAIKEKIALQIENLEDDEEVDISEQEHLFLSGLFLALNNTQL